MLGTAAEPTILNVGDRVAHTKDTTLFGTVRVVEENRLSVMVQWDESLACDLDFQWANKVRRVMP